MAKSSTHFMKIYKLEWFTKILKNVYIQEIYNVVYPSIQTLDFMGNFDHAGDVVNESRDSGPSYPRVGKHEFFNP